MVRRHDRTCAGLGLEVDQQHALRITVRGSATRLHNDRRPPDGVAYLHRTPARFGQLVDGLHLARPEQIPEGAIADDSQLSLGQVSLHGGPGIKQDVEPLLLHEPSHEESLEISIRERRRREELDVDPGRYDLDRLRRKPNRSSSVGEEPGRDYHPGDDGHQRVVVSGRPLSKGGDIRAVE